MARHVVTLSNERLRAKAIEYVQKAKTNSRVEFKGPKRSTDQNAAMWAMLSDIAAQLEWHGQRLTADDFKLVFLDALRRDRHEEMRIVPNTDLTGWVNLSGSSSSDLEWEEMHDLLTIIRAFGDQHGVEWSEPKPKDEMPPLPPVEAYGEETS